MSLEKTIKRAVGINMFPIYAVFGVIIFAFVTTFSKGGATVKDIVPMLVAFGILGAIVYIMYRRKLKPASYWIKLIERRPQDLVWIKPTRVKHKMFVVATVAESAQFELFDVHKNVVKIDASAMKKGLIIKEFMEKTPEVHYGYSREIEKLYKKNPHRFVSELKKQDLYFPVKNYQL